MTLLIPKGYYQKTSGLCSFSLSLTLILTPILATALFAFAGIGWVIAVDLISFAVTVLSLLLYIFPIVLAGRIPHFVDNPGERIYHYITLESGEKVFARINKNALTDTASAVVSVPLQSNC